MTRFTLLMLSIGILFFSNKLHSQQKETIFNDFWAQIGSSIPLNSLRPLNQTEMKKLFTQGDNLNLPVTFSNYNEKDLSTSLSLSLGIKIKNKEKTGFKLNPIWRIGINYYRNQQLLSNELVNVNRFNVDTIFDSQNQPYATADSVIMKKVFAKYETEQIRIESSIIIRTNPSEQWSAYTGFGFNFGFSITAASQLLYSEERNVVLYNFNGESIGNYANTSNQFLNKSTVDSVSNSTNIGGALYIPFGVDYQLKGSPSFKKFHFTTEVRPTVQWLNIPEIGNYTQVLLFYHFGIRYMLN